MPVGSRDVSARELANLKFKETSGFLYYASDKPRA